jgi:hypothetical protein
MARQFTGEELISYVRRKSAVDDDAVLGCTDDDILNIINEELLATIVPVVRRAREEYFVVSRRMAVTAGTTRYRIPERAIGQQLRNVFWYNGTARQRLVMIQPEFLHEQGATITGVPQFFYLEGNHICLPEGMSATGSLEVAYLARPGQLVLSSKSRKIQSVDTVGKILTLTSPIPSDWETTTLGFDVHSPSSGGELKQIALTKITATGSTIEVQEAIDGSVFGTYAPAPGDYVCLSGDAALPAVPIELHIVLGQAAVVRMLEQLEALEAAQAAKATLGEMLQNELSLIENRAEGHTKKIISRNPLWSGGYRTRGSWW